jgi:transposase
MIDKSRKDRVNVTPKQKHEYARLMVEDNYTNKQIMDISGAAASAVTRWKKQYLAEQRGEFMADKTPLDADKRRIRELERQLAESQEDVRLLKKATALFIRDNPNLK